jgi:hypothetical protein
VRNLGVAGSNWRRPKEKKKKNADMVVFKYMIYDDHGVGTGMD